MKKLFGKLEDCWGRVKCVFGKHRFNTYVAHGPEERVCIYCDMDKPD